MVQKIENKNLKKIKKHLKDFLKNTLKGMLPYISGMEIYKNLFNYMENLIKQLDNKLYSEI